MTELTAGSLTAADLGQQFRIEWEGWVHTGSLDLAHHEKGFRDQRKTFVSLRAASGARWMQHLPTEHPVERHE